MRKHSRDLKRADDSAPGNLRGVVSGDIGSFEPDGAAGRRGKLGQEVEHSGLARAVGPDQGVYAPLTNAQVYVVDGHKAFEFLDQVFGLENVAIARRGFSLRLHGSWFLSCRRSQRTSG